MKTVFETVAYFHIENRRLLYVLSRGKQAYMMPGGKKNEGEDNIAALIREIKEELSVDLIPESIQFYKLFEAQAHGKPQGVNVRTFCYLAKHNGVIKPNSEIVDYRFFTGEEYKQMPDTAPLGHIINKHLKEDGMID